MYVRDPRGKRLLAARPGKHVCLRRHRMKHEPPLRKVSLVRGLGHDAARPVGSSQGGSRGRGRHEAVAEIELLKVE